MQYSVLCNTQYRYLTIVNNLNNKKKALLEMSNALLRFFII